MFLVWEEADQKRLEPHRLVMQRRQERVAEIPKVGAPAGNKIRISRKPQKYLLGD